MPITVGLGDTEDDVIERDLQHVLDLGLNAIRVHGHINRRCLYDRADELGLLILQDFPLERTHARSVRNRAVAQAEMAVEQLGHHPSIALWTAHNEPADTSIVPATDWRARLRDVAAQQLPSWNKTVLDRWVKRAFERNDPSRTTIAHSGVLPHFPQLDGTDSHLWYGWRQGEARDLERLARRMPRTVRFVSEFGSDSVPTTAPFFDEQLAQRRWPDLDWDDARRALRLPPRADREPVPTGRFRKLRRLAVDAAALPVVRAARADRDAAPIEVPTHRRVLLLDPGRSGAERVGERARPRAGAQGRLRNGAGSVRSRSSSLPTSRRTGSTRETRCVSTCTS